MKRTEVLHKYDHPNRPPKPPISKELPYPGRIKKPKDDSKFKAILAMLSKVNVNMPLLDLIDNVPSYSKFFKDLNASKKKYLANEKLVLPETANSVVGLPVKQQDPGSFVIDIQMENGKIAKGMLDLGASINLITHALY